MSRRTRPPLSARLDRCKCLSFAQRGGGGIGKRGQGRCGFATATTSSPSVSGRCSGCPPNTPFAGTFRGRDEFDKRSQGTAEVVRGAVLDNKKSRFPGIFSLAKPSDGLEPSTPSLPWSLGGNLSQPTATVFAYLGRSRRRPICDRLPPVAAALLHKCSMIRCPSWLRPGTNPTRRRSPVLPKTPVDRRGRGGPNDNPASRSARRRLG